MAIKKRAKKSKPAKIRRPHKAKRQRAKKVFVTNTTNAYDIQGLLADKIMRDGTSPENGTAIENLIFNATPKVAEIGYDHGFSVGREICQKQGENQNFTKALDRIGLMKALYYPLKDSVVITSRPTSKRPRQIGHSIHVYEAGAISGYLSMSTGLRMNTVEKRCIYNGSDTCQFVSTPLQERAQEQRIELNSIIEGVAYYMIDNDLKKLKNEYYRIMAYLPLLQQPMYEQVRKLLVMSGERIAENYGNENPTRIINNITNYFGVKRSEIRLRRKGKSIIKLRYESYNSIYPYVSMPTAMIVGFISKAMNKRAEVVISTNKDKTYTTTIDFKEKSA